MYHVLRGALCSLDGIGPDDLTIKQLLLRIDGCKELIFAFNQTPEGEATAAYTAHSRSPIFQCSNSFYGK